MKKITNFGVYALIITALFVGTSGFAQAVSTSGSSSYDADTSVTGALGIESSDNIEISTLLNSSGLDATTKTELQASLKNGNARCAALATRDQKETCVKQNISLIRAKLESLMKARGFVGATSPVKDVSGIRGEPKAATDKAVATEDRPTNDRMNNGKDFAAKFANTIARLEAYVERFAKLADRIDARAKELSAKGMDVSVGVKFTASARKELDLAKTSIQAAKDSFKIESAAVTTIKDDSVKPEDKIVYSKAKFKICAAQSKYLTLTAPQQCEMNGMTYVDEDRNTTSASSASETPTQGQGLLTSTEAKFQNIASAYTKTRAHVKAASQHIVYATTFLMQANSSLTETEQNFRVKNSAGAATN